MVVDQVDIHGISALETEDDPQVPRDPHRPKAVEIAAQPMQPQPGAIHVFGTFGGVQLVEDPPDPSDMGLRQAAAVILLLEAAQVAMAKVSDHRVRRVRLVSRDRFKIRVREPLDPEIEISRALSRLCEVVVQLELEPDSRIAAESHIEANSEVRGDRGAGLADHQELVLVDAHVRRRLSNAEAAIIDAEHLDRFAWMAGVCVAHRCTSSLMIVNQIDINDIGAVEPKDDSQVRRDADRPEPVEITSQPVEPQAVNVHVVRR